MFTVMFPLTFLANTFAPTENMPDMLRTIAEWNPISSLVQAVRELWGNGAARARETRRCRCSTRCIATLIWVVAHHGGDGAAVAARVPAAYAGLRCPGRPGHRAPRLGDPYFKAVGY